MEYAELLRSNHKGTNMMKLKPKLEVGDTVQAYRTNDVSRINKVADILRVESHLPCVVQFREINK
jgi:hypothetical protein